MLVYCNATPSARRKPATTKVKPAISRGFRTRAFSLCLVQKNSRTPHIIGDTDDFQEAETALRALRASWGESSAYIKYNNVS